MVDEYDHEGAFVRQFDEEITWYAKDITADDEGRIMIVSATQSCIHVFTDDREQLSKFHINTEEYLLFTLTIGCHPEGEYVVVDGKEENPVLCSVSIYTKDFKFVRKITPHEYQIVHFNGITVTRKGQIAVVVSDRHGNSKVIVL